jgi:hypothetical protein
VALVQLQRPTRGSRYGRGFGRPGAAAAGRDDRHGVRHPGDAHHRLHRLALVVSGEVTLELDAGAQAVLRAGDVVIQNGTRHAWRNHGTESCMIVGYLPPAGGVAVRRCYSCTAGSMFCRTTPTSPGPRRVKPSQGGSYDVRNLVGIPQPISLTDTHPPEAIELLRTGRIEVAIIFRYDETEPEPAGVRLHHLLDDSVYVLSPRQERSLADLHDATWIAGCERCRSHLLSVCADAGFDPRIGFSSDDMVVIQALVAAGLGVATQSGLALLAHHIEGVVATELPDSMRHIYAATYGEPPDPPPPPFWQPSPRPPRWSPPPAEPPPIGDRPVLTVPHNDVSRSGIAARTPGTPRRPCG